MATKNTYFPLCSSCHFSFTPGCSQCPHEENRPKTIHKFVGIRKIEKPKNMPFKDPKYQHIRRRPPRTIVPDSYYTVPVSHTKATGTYPKGTIARIGRSRKTGNMVIQAILIPLKRGG